VEKNMADNENNQPLRISLPPQSDLDFDVETWSYTIKGNKTANDYLFEIKEIIRSFATPEERQQKFKYGRSARNYSLSEDIRKENNEKRLDMEVELTNRAYPALIDFATRKNSRLAFFMIAVDLMVYRMEIPPDLKEKVLDYADFEKYEAFQFSSPKFIDARKKYLDDFKQRVRSHQKGMKTLVPWESLDDVYEKTPPDEHGDRIVALSDIDYSI
jgi:hypothetical protein